MAQGPSNPFSPFLWGGVKLLRNNYKCKEDAPTEAPGIMLLAKTGIVLPCKVIGRGTNQHYHMDR